MGLKKYKEKRNFKKTSEPISKTKKVQKDLIFVVQKHDATNLHYDFRLELDGVLKSWAVPKGPSLNPKDKRLAVMVEDHPFDYKDFEGVIPKGNYGAGEVVVWDNGTYHSMETEDRTKSIPLIKKGLEKGDLKITLHGKKLRGSFALVNMKRPKQNAWLLIKKKDGYATEEDILLNDKSVLSGKGIDEIEEKVKKKVLLDKPLKKELAKLPRRNFPSYIKPMLAELSGKAFSDQDWIFEIKWDGYRAVAEIKDGEINLHSRNNISFNEKYFPVVETLRRFNMDVVFDGEIVAVDDFGKASFQLLQTYGKTGKGKLAYYIFDILYLNGADLTNLPLIKRKEILKKIIPIDLVNVKYSDHIVGDGESFFKIAEQRGLEGILAKRAESKYFPGKRSKDWLKLKTKKRQEAIICGFTEPKGSRNKFGSLVLAIYDEGDLLYIGQAGTGFTDNDLKNIYSKLKPLITNRSSFKKKIETNAPVTWVTPKYICDVEFSEWTDEGLMRQPAFIGIREDKNIDDVIKENSIEDDTGEETTRNNNLEKEVKIDGHKLQLTNLKKVYFQDEGYTKGDVIEYYRSVAKYILPYLKGRPESLNRHPNGIDGESFYQKDIRDLPPDWVKTEMIYSEHNEKDINYLVCNDEATLVYLANLGCIEINPWFSRVETLDNPDYLVLDLDPEDISFEKVIETALAAKEIFDAAGAKNYCKTSGATGLHIYVPLGTNYNYDVAREFTHLVARLVHAKTSGFTSLKRSPSKRQKKVYLDYLQNRPGQTLAAPYSVRPRPGAPVATPLKWEEVKKGLNPKDFTIKNTLKRIEKKGDLFKNVLGKGIDLGKCISKLETYAKKKK